VAGLIANIFDFVGNAYLFAEEMEANSRMRNLDPAVLASTGVMVSWIAFDFLYGILIVFTYASIRPRFGPGPKTAVIAALIPYLAITLILYCFATMGFFTMPLFWKSAFYALVIAIVAGLVGGRLYSE
jgi:hypothetical protein